MFEFSFPQVMLESIRQRVGLFCSVREIAAITDYILLLYGLGGFLVVNRYILLLENVSHT